MLNPLRSLCLIALVLSLGVYKTGAQTRIIAPKLTLRSGQNGDQDDMCFWIHPTDRSLSTIIASDKDEILLFVYDLEGNTIQVVEALGKPGNIDVRYGFPLGGKYVDIVGYIERDNKVMILLKVDSTSRRITRIDDGSMTGADGSGACLYHSLKTGKYYAFTSDGQQYELFDNGRGKIGGKLVRFLDRDDSEGCVADDETGYVYIGEQKRGIWKFGAEPDDPTMGTLISRIGQYGMVADVEGLTIYYAAGGEGYLIASSQGNSTFKVFNRKPPHEYITTFTVEGAEETDGCDVTSVNLGPDFPEGLFALHNGGVDDCPVEVIAFEDIGLRTDTHYWDPRKTGAFLKVPGRGKTGIPARIGKWRVVVGAAGNDLFIGLVGEPEELEHMREKTEEEMWPDPSEAVLRWAKYLSPQAPNVKWQHDSEVFPPDFKIKAVTGDEQYEFTITREGALKELKYKYEKGEIEIEEEADGFVLKGKKREIPVLEAPKTMLTSLAEALPDSKPSKAWSAETVVGKRFIVQVGDLAFYAATEGIIRAAGRVDEGALEEVDPDKEDDDDEGQVVASAEQVIGKYGNQFHFENVIKNKLGKVPKNGHGSYRYIVMSGRHDNPDLRDSMIKHIESLHPKPDFIILTGDLVETGQPEEYRDYVIPTLKSTNIPVLAVIGARDGGVDRTAGAFRYLFGEQSLNYYFDYGKSRYIFFDTVTKVRPFSENLEWLQRVLADTPRRYRKYVVAHKPPVTIEKWAYNAWHVKESRVFAKSMSQYDVDHVYSSSIPAYSTAHKDGVDYTVSGGGSTPKGYFGPLGSVPHYIICDVTRDALEQHVVRFCDTEAEKLGATK